MLGRKERKGVGGGVTLPGERRPFVLRLLPLSSLLLLSALVFRYVVSGSGLVLPQVCLPLSHAVEPDLPQRGPIPSFLPGVVHVALRGDGPMQTVNSFFIHTKKRNLVT